MGQRPAVASDGEGDIDQPRPERSGEERAAVGAFLPWTATPSKPASGGVAQVTGGYDGARGRGTFEASADVTLWGPLSVHGGGVYSTTLQELRPVVGLAVQALRQGRHGVDGAVMVNYRAEGFNLVPSVETMVAVGRRLDRASVFANVAYQVGTREGERAGGAQVSALYRVGRALHLGLDSRVRVDLEREFPEPPGEASLDLLAGPVATYSLGRYAVTTYAGYSGLKLRAGDPLTGSTDQLKSGLAAGMGFGGAF